MSMAAYVASYIVYAPQLIGLVRRARETTDTLKNLRWAAANTSWAFRYVTGYDTRTNRPKMSIEECNYVLVVDETGESVELCYAPSRKSVEI